MFLYYGVVSKLSTSCRLVSEKIGGTEIISKRFRLCVLRCFIVRKVGRGKKKEGGVNLYL